MREINGLDTDELTRVLSVSVTNLGVMLHRARNRLRECLEAKGAKP
jgi:RNA polymerase sigma-70 factor (ECF subfamily)